MPLVYKQNLEFDKIEWKKDVTKELENGRELNAFFLVYGYIEAYLRDWLFISSPIEKKKFPKEIKTTIERLGFYNLLHVHLILGHIDNTLYVKIRDLNKSRNIIVHNLITIDTNSEKTKDYIKKIVVTALDICNEIASLYTKTLDEKSRIV